MASTDLRYMASKLNRLREASDMDDQVSLSQFAAICGLTEREYVQAMYSALERHRMLDLLKKEAKEDFLSWVAQAGRPFCIMFRLSLNRTKDACLYCKCSMGSGDDVIVADSIPGLSGLVPPEFRDVDGFEFNFCDLRTNVELGD